VAGRTRWSWKFASQRQPSKLTSPRGKAPPPSHPQAASPDGKLLAVVTPSDRRFRLVSLTQDRPARVLMNLSRGYEHRLAFSGDGRFVALSNASDRSVTIFDPAKAEQVRRLMPADSPTIGAPLVRFAPDGRSLLECDREGRLIETLTGGLRLRLRRHG